MPNAELVEVDSTAKGVLIAKESSDGAAIGSELAAQSHQVGVVAAKSIQDRMDNSTRFLVVGETPSPAIGNGQDRTSLVLSVRDEVSALQKVLEPFSKRGINLCKIESSPTRLKPWEYYFIDIIGHYDDPVVKEAFEELKGRSLFIVIGQLSQYCSKIFALPIRDGSGLGFFTGTGRIRSGETRLANFTGIAGSRCAFRRAGQCSRP